MIDGNGGAPVPNSSIVIEGNRITSVGAAGQVEIPQGAQVIEAAGKWVLPGLMDAKSNWYWHYGETALAYGTTSAFVSGGRNDTGIALRDAVNQGLIEAPRLFQTYVAIRGKGPNGDGPDEYRPGEGNKMIASAEEAVQWVKNAVEAGADFITFGDGNGPKEWWAAGVKEAEAANKAIVFRAMGPQTRAREVCAMGNGIVYVHTGNLGAQVAHDEAKWAQYVQLPPDAYADMDDAKAGAMIEQLVACNAYLEPDLMAADRGFHKGWSRVQTENEAFLVDENLKAYYPPHSNRGVIENAKSPETYLDPEQLELRRAGFLNHVALMKRYVDAGGKIVPASDNPQTHPGLGLHQEITAFVEDVGITPMQAILSATKWTAEAFKQSDLGVVANGKLADVIIVNADPLADIKNLRQIDTVIKDGKIVDRTYNKDYPAHIFANTRDNYEAPVVSNLGWMEAVKRATWRPNNRNGGWGQSGGLDSELAPPPGVEAITPYVVDQHSTDTQMTITGFNFVKGSEVLVDGTAVPAQVTSRTELMVTLPAALLTRPGKHSVVVKNPLPLAYPEWGDRSNPAYFLVPYAFTKTHSHNKF